MLNVGKCAGGACDPWMGGGGTADSSDSSAFSLPDIFLTLGLAALSALWLAIYVLLFTAFRIFTKTPDNASDKPLDGFKRYVYRATRVFLVVNVILVPSLLIDVIVKANSYRGSEGLTSVVGAGVVRECTMIPGHGRADSSDRLCIPVHIALDANRARGSGRTDIEVDIETELPITVLWMLHPRGPSGRGRERGGNDETQRQARKGQEAVPAATAREIGSSLPKFE